jgi:tRNA (guanosine-2'-O-)-methyltransferase
VGQEDEANVTKTWTRRVARRAQRAFPPGTNGSLCWLGLPLWLLAQGCHPAGWGAGVVGVGPVRGAGAGFASAEGAPRVAEGVSPLGYACSGDAAEQCNGLDDDCDGAIDEGCGYLGGAIQVTLAWDTGADLDLYVTDPFGDTVSYERRSARSGALLDRDARGACASGQGDATVENVYWSTPRPPSGRYRVDVNYWGDCGVAGATTATLSISVGGQLAGAYAVPLQPGEHRTVAVFDLP